MKKVRRSLPIPVVDHDISSMRSPARGLCHNDSYGEHTHYRSRLQQHWIHGTVILFGYFRQENSQNTLGCIFTRNISKKQHRRFWRGLNEGANRTFIVLAILAILYGGKGIAVIPGVILKRDDAEDRLATVAFVMISMPRGSRCAESLGDSILIETKRLL
ncbi:hypothetical protein BJ875DRAFT_7791 [Amylocarpus encephaloides]|uniref:Uncharacterized protein n=1 Tax=Amylocarpus encephaloides TaxID=45428 RepID=A0A9P8C5V3_9HELO|nr:hypothetical protein BJ875DRAFT_7791 [Amylocarpus encephaloides]